MFDQIRGEIINELNSERINEPDAFGYAKKMIRREAAIEGILLFERKLNSYAAE